MRYTVSMSVDTRVEVEIEAKTPEEAFELARNSSDYFNEEWVSWPKPVNASGDDGSFYEY